MPFTHRLLCRGGTGIRTRWLEHKLISDELRKLLLIPRRHLPPVRRDAPPLNERIDEPLQRAVDRERRLRKARRLRFAALKDEKVGLHGHAHLIGSDGDDMLPAAPEAPSACGSMLAVKAKGHTSIAIGEGCLERFWPLRFRCCTVKEAHGAEGVHRRCHRRQLIDLNPRRSLSQAADVRDELAKPRVDGVARVRVTRAGVGAVWAPQTFGPRR